MDLSRDFAALTANLSDLLGQHFKIARLELIADLQRLTNRAVLLLVMVPFAIGSFVLLTQSAIGLLSRFWPQENVLGGLGILYGLITALAAMLAVKRPASPGVLSESKRELVGTAKALAGAAKGSR